MTDHELLLAISNIMDKKLDARLKPLENTLQSLKEDVQQLKEDVQQLKDDVQQLKDDVQQLKDDVQQTKSDVQQLKAEVHQLKAEMHQFEAEMHQLKLYQENVILPRLQNIESCYMDTYKRYQDGVGQIDAMQTDIDVMKSVLLEHSDRLQKIS